MAKPSEFFVVGFLVIGSLWRKRGVNSPLENSGRGCHRMCISRCSIHGSFVLPHVGSSAPHFQRMGERKRFTLSKGELERGCPGLVPQPQPGFRNHLLCHPLLSGQFPPQMGGKHHHPGSDRGSQLPIFQGQPAYRQSRCLWVTTGKGLPPTPVPLSSWTTEVRCGFRMKQIRVWTCFPHLPAVAPRANYLPFLH